MGREAAGVRGVKLSDDQRVNALIVAEQGYILTASENGFGKLTPLEDFPTPRPRRPGRDRAAGHATATAA